MTVYTGTPGTLSAGDTTNLLTVVNDHRDALKSITDAWSTYGSASSFTGSGSNPTGQTWVGHYSQTTKTVKFWVKVTLGAGVGSGTYRIALPVSIHASHPGLFEVRLTDTSAGLLYRGVTWSPSGTTLSLAYGSTASSQIAPVTPTAPFTFASGDVIDVLGTYEAA